MQEAKLDACGLVDVVEQALEVTIGACCVGVVDSCLVTSICCDVLLEPPSPRRATIAKSGVGPDIKGAVRAFVAVRKVSCVSLGHQKARHRVKGGHGRL